MTTDRTGLTITRIFQMPTINRQASNCEKILALFEGLLYFFGAFAMLFGYLTLNRFALSTLYVWIGSVFSGLLFMIGMMWSTLFW